MQDYGEAITEIFKNRYAKQKETIDYLCLFGAPAEKAKASLIREVALKV